jgi:hypothetical protein
MRELIGLNLLDAVGKYRVSMRIPRHPRGYTPTPEGTRARYAPIVGGNLA